jgi:hypothetical protein
MSWSFYAIGKPAAVVASAEKALSAYECSEPEESIKNKVLNIIQVSLAAMPDASAVSIEASGSQSAHHDHADKFTNTLSFIIKPIYGFVE